MIWYNDGVELDVGQREVSGLRLMPPTELFAKFCFRMTGQGGMLSDFGILLFQALERGNAGLFGLLSF